MTEELKMPDEWEEWTIRVKKDPDYPNHGTEIELNGMRYIRADLAPAVDDVQSSLPGQPGPQRILRGLADFATREDYDGKHMRKELYAVMAMIPPDDIAPAVDDAKRAALAEAINDCENAPTLNDPKSLNHGMALCFNDQLKIVTEAARQILIPSVGVKICATCSGKGGWEEDSCGEGCCRSGVRCEDCKGSGQALAAPDHTELLREALERACKVIRTFEKQNGLTEKGKDYVSEWEKLAKINAVLGSVDNG